MKISINKDTMLPHLLPLFEDTHPVTILFGSASSGKSYTMMTYSVLWALRGQALLIARKQANQIRKSVLLEVKKAIDRMGLKDFFHINMTDLVVTCTVNKGSISFVGVDDENKLKSITPPLASAFDTVILEEADSFSSEDFDQLQLRRRGSTKWAKRMIMIFNPVSIRKMQWVWDRWFEPNGWNDEEDMYFENDEVLIQRCNYDKNVFLTDDDRQSFERLKRDNPRKFKIYGEGRFGSAGKTIFNINSYEMSDFDYQDMLDRAIRGRSSQFELRIGADFGFTHKSAITVSVWDRINNRIYIVGEYAKSGLTDFQFANNAIDLLEELNIPLHTTILCDSASPASIKEMVSCGLTGAKKAHKCNGSVTPQIDFLQSHYIYIHSRCKDIYGEFTALEYKRDKMGNYTEKIDDSINNDDCVASLRYAFSYEAWNRSIISFSGYNGDF